MAERLRVLLKLERTQYQSSHNSNGSHFAPTGLLPRSHDTSEAAAVAGAQSSRSSSCHAFYEPQSCDQLGEVCLKGFLQL